MITIFTPIYNRKYIIERLYKSLINQTNKNFEWIVIDDGSTDGVYELLKEWAEKEKSFSMRVFNVENGGKHRAINIAVNKAMGEAFFIVDSDDYLSEEAIEFIDVHFPEVKGDEYAGISGLRYSPKRNSAIGSEPFFDDYVDATNLEREKYGLIGDKAEVYKTTVLKKYPFPEYEGENFITEEVVWNKIASDGLKLRWYNKPIYYCEYLEDGLTNQGHALFERNPKGWARWICDAEQYKYWKEDLIKSRIKDFIIFNFDKDFYSDVKRDIFATSVMIESTEAEVLAEIALLTTFIQDNLYQSISFYGYGVRGKRLEQYFRIGKLNIKYFVDKNAEVINLEKVVKISETLSVVDLLIITMKNPAFSEEEKHSIEKISRKAVTIQDIIPMFI